MRSSWWWNLARHSLPKQLLFSLLVSYFLGFIVVFILVGNKKHYFANLSKKWPVDRCRWIKPYSCSRCWTLVYVTNDSFTMQILRKLEAVNRYFFNSFHSSSFFVKHCFLYRISLLDFCFSVYELHNNDNLSSIWWLQEIWLEHILH